MGYIETLGQQVGSSATGGALGIGLNMLDEAVFGDKRRKDQLNQQQALTAQQLKANKELSDYGMGLQKQMWDYTNYENQIKHMKEAGLNPALMYGSAGASGTTGSGASGSAGSGTASDETSRKQSSIAQQGMGLQMQMMQAQIEKTKSETKLNEQNAGLSNAKVGEVKANIQEITQNIANKEVQKEGMMIQNNMSRLNEEILENTKEANIDIVNYNVNMISKQLSKIDQEINNMNIDNEIKLKTKNEIIESVRLQNEETIASILMKEAGANLSREQAMNISRELGVKISQLGINMDSNEIQRQTNRLTNETMRANNITGVVGSAISSLALLFVGKGLGATKMVK